MTDNTVKTATYVIVPFIKTRRLHKQALFSYMSKIILKRADNQIEKIIQHLNDKEAISVKVSNIRNKAYEDIADMEKSLNYAVGAGKTNKAYLTIRLSSFRHFIDKDSVSSMGFSHVFQINTNGVTRFDHIEYIDVPISQLEGIEAIVNLLGI